MGGLVVVDDQDRAAARCRGGLQCALGGLGRGPEAAGRQHDREGRALTGRALDRDLAAQHPAELPGDRQAEPGAAVVARGRGFGLGERLKQLAELRLGHADAGIRDLELEPVALVPGQPSGGERDRALLGELGGIAQQIEQVLAQLRLIGAHCTQIRRAVDHQRVRVLSHQRLDHRLDLADHRRDVEVLDQHVHLAGLDLGQIEDVVDQAQEVLAGAIDLLEIGQEGVLTEILGLLVQHLAVADDGVERRPQLMAHARQELALRLARAYGFVARGGELAGALPHELLQSVVETLQADVRLIDLARLLFGNCFRLLARLPRPFQAPLELLNLAHGAALLLVSRNRAAVPVPSDRSSIAMSTASP